MKIVEKAKTTKNFVYKHRVAIAVTATSVFWMRAMARNTAATNDFLKAHGLYEEFWTEIVKEDLAAA